MRLWRYACCAETAIACLKCDQEAASQERDSALAEVETLSTAFGKAQTDLDAAWKLQSRDQQQARAEAKASEDALGTAKALEESLRHQLAEAQAALRAKESECVAAVNAATRAQLIAKTQEVSHLGAFVHMADLYLKLCAPSASSCQRMDKSYKAMLDEEHSKAAVGLLRPYSIQQCLIGLVRAFHLQGDAQWYQKLARAHSMR